jgi:transcriptional regulator with XRE-family HTH domain
MPSKPKHAVSRNVIGDRLRKARQLFTPPLTQDQLSGRLAAEGTDLDRVAIAKIESGLRSAFDFEVRALALVLKVDVRWLLGMDSAAETPAKKTNAV